MMLAYGTLDRARARVDFDRFVICLWVTCNIVVVGGAAGEVGEGPAVVASSLLLQQTTTLERLFQKGRHFKGHFVRNVQ